MKFVYYLVLLVGGVLITSHAQAQSYVEEDMPTRKVNKKTNENKKSNFPEQKKIRSIYVREGKNLLYGNPCAMQVTQKMGFEYELEHRPDSRFQTKWRRFKNNTGTKSMLCLKHGLWWKATVNKRMKGCAQYSGDRRG